MTIWKNDGRGNPAVVVCFAAARGVSSCFVIIRRRLYFVGMNKNMDYKVERRMFVQHHRLEPDRQLLQQPALRAHGADDRQPAVEWTL